MPREHVTACIIAQNERSRLPAALASVSFCDEIIVVDGGSTDGTPAIARAHGARVIENPWPGFAKQRNVAIDAAANDWILEVDADERISPRLRESIETMLSSAPEQAIAVFALRNRFLGGALGPSAQYPAYRSRLFRRDAYRHNESRAVHEGIYPRERPIVLEGDLEHELASTLAEALADTWSYARLESLHIAAASAADCFVGIVLRPTAKLFYRAVVVGGWRDGWRGALKISLDVSSDSLVWVLALARHRREPLRRDDATQASATHRGHFGLRSEGPAKIVAIAPSGQPASRASQWLSELREQGLDVTLITDEAGERHGLPVRRVEAVSPLAVLEALRTEMDLRAIDVVVPVGRRAQLVHRLLPRLLRPDIPGVGIGVDPAQAARTASDAVAKR